jgi:para-aminobenzoate synthetase component 1
VSTSIRLQELDWVDPVRAFWAVRHHEGVAFLDSALRGHTASRWTYLALDPAETIEIRRDATVLRRRGESSWQVEPDWREALRRRLPAASPGAPRNIPPFAGGWIGWLGYELAPEFDRIPVRAEPLPGTPLASFAFYDTLDAFDLMERRRWRVSFGDGGIDLPETEGARATPAPLPAPAGWVTDCLPPERFMAAVEEAKERIRAGEIYQVNLSRQFRLDPAPDPASTLIRLRENSPAPYAAFLSSSAGTLVSSSPELFLEYDPIARRAVSRPIKGTRPRGTSHAEDVLLARELASSPKDRAENVMIVDLIRHDLGRVCQTGSVRVSELCRTEIHPTVFHLVSTVEGILRPGLDALDALDALFPGGSITGAPKIRSCHVIRELEPVPRGPYTGALGYLSVTGHCALAMAIRVVWFCGGTAVFSAGGGIVADSDPEAELRETEVKAAAMKRALGISDA